MFKFASVFFLLMASHLAGQSPETPLTEDAFKHMQGADIMQGEVQFIWGENCYLLEAQSANKTVIYLTELSAEECHNGFLSLSDLIEPYKAEIPISSFVEMKSPFKGRYLDCLAGAFNNEELFNSTYYRCVDIDEIIVSR